MRGAWRQSSEFTLGYPQLVRRLLNCPVGATSQNSRPSAPRHARGGVHSPTASALLPAHTAPATSVHLNEMRKLRGVRRAHYMRHDRTRIL